MGLQGSLILSFMFMLSGALIGSCWMYSSETRSALDRSALRHTELTLVLINLVAMLVSFPVVYALVHRIFDPIRELVDATRKIAAGDLAAEVAVHRTDVIGTLARSFNDMVERVRRQQADLEHANQKLAEVNRDLETKVRQRTGQLKAANERLHREIDEKEDFLRAVSHDLGAPLRNISGMASMLLAKHASALDVDAVHRLHRIQKNVEVQTSLIAELLELSRIKSRRQRIEPVNLGSVVGELAEMFDEDLRTGRIEFVVDNILPVLMCERARLRQVFQNLIDNAVKYMGDQPGKAREIHVGCVLRGEQTEFYVRDTGIGIGEEDVDKVFYVFRRGKSAQVQQVAGKGVGLSSVKSIVETYGGAIWLESRPGEGSTFRFTINGSAAETEQTLEVACG